MSCSNLCRFVVTGELSRPTLVEFFANIVCTWSLIASYLKETGKKHDGVIFVLYQLMTFHPSCVCTLVALFCFVLEEKKWWLILCRQMARLQFRQFHMFRGICKFDFECFFIWVQLIHVCSVELSGSFQLHCGVTPFFSSVMEFWLNLEIFAALPVSRPFFGTSFLNQQISVSFLVCSSIRVIR